MEVIVFGVAAAIIIVIVVYWRVVDPLKSVLNVANYRGALQGVAVTAIRDLVAEVPAADVVFRRRQLEADVLPRLQNVPERWGGIITSVEIRDITAREC